MKIRYTSTSDRVNIAYSVAGQGPPLLVSLPPMAGHLQADWQIPLLRHYYQRLARCFTLIRFDHRGGGLSGRAAGRYSTAHLAEDVNAVIAALDLPRVALWCSGRAAASGAYFAAHHADRLSHLIFWIPLVSGDDYARSSRTQALHSAEVLDPEVADRARGSLLTGDDAGDAAPNLIDFIARVRAATDPQAVKALEVFDARPWLAGITTPTLILTRREARYDNERVARDLAAQIADAQMAVLGGRSALPYLGDVQEIIDHATVFVTGRQTERQDSDGDAAAVRIILFTDVENSTSLTDRVGDAAARAILRRHDAQLRQTLARYGGTEIKTTGDGFMIAFASASQALDAAIAMQRAIMSGFIDGDMPIRIRIGIHAGEPIAEQNDLHGSAVIRAARIMSQADGGQILASDLVRQLVAGKRYTFNEHGTVTLKGFSEAQRLFEVEW